MGMFTRLRAFFTFNTKKQKFEKRVEDLEKRYFKLIDKTEENEQKWIQHIRDFNENYNGDLTPYKKRMEVYANIIAQMETNIKTNQDEISKIQNENSVIKNIVEDNVSNINSLNNKYTTHENEIIHINQTINNEKSKIQKVIKQISDIIETTQDEMLKLKCVDKQQGSEIDKLILKNISQDTQIMKIQNAKIGNLNVDTIVEASKINKMKENLERHDDRIEKLETMILTYSPTPDTFKNKSTEVKLKKQTQMIEEQHTKIEKLEQHFKEIIEHSNFEMTDMKSMKNIIDGQTEVLTDLQLAIMDLKKNDEKINKTKQNDKIIQEQNKKIQQLVTYVEEINTEIIQKQNKKIENLELYVHNMIDNFKNVETNNEETSEIKFMKNELLDKIQEGLTKMNQVELSVYDVEKKIETVEILSKKIKELEKTVSCSKKNIEKIHENSIKMEQQQNQKNKEFYVFVNESKQKIGIFRAQQQKIDEMEIVINKMKSNIDVLHLEISEMKQINKEPKQNLMIQQDFETWAKEIKNKFETMETHRNKIEILERHVYNLKHMNKDIHKEVIKEVEFWFNERVVEVIHAVKTPRDFLVPLEIKLNEHDVKIEKVNLKCDKIDQCVQKMVKTVVSSIGDTSVPTANKRVVSPPETFSSRHVQTIPTRNVPRLAFASKYSK